MMTDYTELVKVLRGKFIAYDVTGNHNSAQLYKDAAAAIEDMAKHITEMHERVTVLQIARGELEAEVKRLEPKRGEWITIRLNNGGSYTGCSCCEAPIPTDTMLDYIPETESKYCYSCGAKMTEVQDG